MVPIFISRWKGPTFLQCLRLLLVFLGIVTTIFSIRYGFLALGRMQTNNDDYLASTMEEKAASLQNATDSLGMRRGQNTEDFIDPFGLNGNETFSACVSILVHTSTLVDSLSKLSLLRLCSCALYSDDNPRLVEWVAYHYFSLPLRHLVLLADARSTSSPDHILDRWRRYMTIEVWSDRVNLPFLWEEVQTRGNSTEPGLVTSVGYDVHRKRQDAFYGTCAKHLKRLNRTWVSFHDVDEYWVINSDYVHNSAELMSRPGIVLTMLKNVRASIAEGKTPHNEHYEGPCVSTYRRQYGAVESSLEEQSRDVPAFLRARDFDTLRWRHYSKLAVIGKSVMDVSLVPLHNITWFGTHRVIQLCPHAFHKKRHYFRVHHYVGSWESYNSRANDPRKVAGGTKGRKYWEKQAYIDEGSDDVIRPWIRSFVRHMGDDLSKELLQGAGIYTNN